jgi:hypothetical protein
MLVEKGRLTVVAPLDVGQHENVIVELKSCHRLKASCQFHDSSVQTLVNGVSHHELVVAANVALGEWGRDGRNRGSGRRSESWQGDGQHGNCGGECVEHDGRGSRKLVAWTLGILLEF